MKTALITGGVNRIGKAIALALADKGYNIALHYGKSDPADTVKEIQNKGVQVIPFYADLNNEVEMEQLIPDVAKQFSKLDILVNNASVFEPGKILDTNFALFNQHLNINFKAPFFLSLSFKKIFKTGNIINIVDGKISRNDHDYSIYLLSKKNLMEFTKMAAVEFAPEIRVNAIAPGAILPPKGEGEAYLSQRAKEAPLNKTGNLHDITNAIDFLIQNEFITGQCINIDGGINLI